MMTDLINAGIGLVIGAMTGFYFERRATKKAEQQSIELEEQLRNLKDDSRRRTAELEAQLVKLRVGVYSVGGEEFSTDQRPMEDDSLSNAVLHRAREVLDPEGRVSKTALTSFFFASGYRCKDVEDAVSALCAQGLASENGKWVEVR